MSEEQLQRQDEDWERTASIPHEGSWALERMNVSWQVLVLFWVGESMPVWKDGNLGPPWVI